jgi:hypothetical protein
MAALQCHPPTDLFSTIGSPSIPDGSMPRSPRWVSGSSAPRPGLPGQRVLCAPARQPPPRVPGLPDPVRRRAPASGPSFVGHALPLRPPSREPRAGPSGAPRPSRLRSPVIGSRETRGSWHDHSSAGSIMSTAGRNERRNRAKVIAEERWGKPSEKFQDSLTQDQLCSIF